ncbi:MAG: O-antigen ligase family protein [bacterium]
MRGNTSFGTRVAIAGAAVAAAAAVFLGTMKVGTLATVAVSCGLFVSAMLLARPDLGTFLFLILAYTNAVVHLGGAVGSPMVVGAVLTGLLAVPVFVHVFVGRQPWVIDYPFLLMIAFGGASLASTLVAKDVELALEWVLTFALEGLILYFLLQNAVRTISRLRQIMWVTVVVGAVLSSLAVYQELTGSYEQQFGGLMQRNTERGYGDEGLDNGVAREREVVHTAHRAAGPVGGPNRFAQILLTMLPLSLILLWTERARDARVLAGLTSALIVSGIFLTYSRGGSVALFALVGLLFVFGYLRLRQILIGGVVAFALVIVVAPGYIGRIESMLGLQRFVSEAAVEKQQGDATIRGRLTEMLAALHVFLDHPVVGVGPGQFSPFYSLEYMQNPEIQFRHIENTRRAHILYFELAAETGIIGLALFLTIAGVVLVRLGRLRRSLRLRRPDLSHLAAAFYASLAMYFVTAVFLHFSYQRYYWIALALGAIAARLVQQESEKTTPEEEAAAAAWLVEELQTPETVVAS